MVFLDINTVMKRNLFIAIVFAILCNCISCKTNEFELNGILLAEDGNINIELTNMMTTSMIITAYNQYYDEVKEPYCRMLFLDGLLWRCSKDDKFSENGKLLKARFNLPPFRKIYDREIDKDYTMGYEYFCEKDTLPPFKGIIAPRLWKTSNLKIDNDFTGFVVGDVYENPGHNNVKTPIAVFLWSEECRNAVAFQRINALASCKMFENNFLPDTVVYRLDGQYLTGEDLRKLFVANIHEVKYIKDKNAKRIVIDVKTSDRKRHQNTKNAVRACE